MHILHKFSIDIEIIWKKYELFIIRPIVVKPLTADEKTLDLEIIFFSNCQLINARICLQREYVKK